MAIARNTIEFSSMPGRRMGGESALSLVGLSRAERRNWHAGWHASDATAGFPNGHLHPSSWLLPERAGGMSAYTTVGGNGSISATGQAALSGEATIGGSGGMSAAGGLIVSLAATLAGGGGISSAAVQAFLNLAATIGGSGGASGAAAGLAALAATLVGAGTAAGSTASGVGSMSATLRGYGELTPEGIRDAVWKALANDFNTAGSMGAKLNSASAAGDPWGATLPGSYPAGSAGAILGRYMVDVWRRLGLDSGSPQVTTQAGLVTTITDGALTLTITEGPDGSVTVQRS